MKSSLIKLMFGKTRALSLCNLEKKDVLDKMIFITIANNVYKYKYQI